MVRDCEEWGIKASVRLVCVPGHSGCNEPWRTQSCRACCCLKPVAPANKEDVVAAGWRASQRNCLMHAVTLTCFFHPCLPSCCELLSAGIWQQLILDTPGTSELRNVSEVVVDRHIDLWKIMRCVCVDDTDNADAGESAVITTCLQLYITAYGRCLMLCCRLFAACRNILHYDACFDLAVGDGLAAVKWNRVEMPGWAANPVQDCESEGRHEYASVHQLVD